MSLIPFLLAETSQLKASPVVWLHSSQGALSQAVIYFVLGSFCVNSI